MEVGNSTPTLNTRPAFQRSLATNSSTLSRGFRKKKMGLIVNGFFEPFTRELPMEYAVELNKLLELEMEGSIG